MKKIYLVKKDINKPAGDGNWITMSPYEFAQFMKTTEGYKRRKYFAQIDACNYDDKIIVMECDQIVLAKKIRAEKDAHDYLMGIANEIGYTVFSYNEQTGSEDDMSGEELLKDDSIETEDEIITRIYNSNIVNIGLNHLTTNEREFIESLFLIDKPLNVQECSIKYGISEDLVYQRKHRILLKLKKILKKCQIYL